jgi:hypothetical protein
MLFRCVPWTYSPSPSLEGRDALGRRLLSLVTPHGVALSPSLYEGMSVLKAVGPSLVEKVRIPKCFVLFTRREGGRSISPDMKGLGVRRSGTFR